MKEIGGILFVIGVFLALILPVFEAISAGLATDTAEEAARLF